MAPTKARQRLMAGRIIAGRRWRYLASMLFSLSFVEVPPTDLATMSVDRRWRLYYRAGFVMSWDPETLATALLQECGHLMRNHAQRFEGLQPPADRHNGWNIAGDR